MSTKEILIYRTKDNTSDYKFEFVTTGAGTERAYILWQPSYFDRSADGHSTHRYWDEDRQQHYICFEPEPSSRAEVKRVARQWAEHTNAYRRHGTRF
ncbi:hypothetical protein [Candidatus Symbiobacter mobilis]|uniref:Uncharacterized protein n=1 Tax=Candidatus Symbiobacter mobilis CR TaxID=946483 RepID=U5NAW6_9BURK|nr:hypothetical protein [Candidatus Symbiobacter mobilis]AGX88721.1 hypothetical protein Cenrod_2671 [Candidatus Symbiobacter mobilis CR]